MQLPKPVHITDKDQDQFGLMGSGVLGMNHPLKIAPVPIHGDKNIVPTILMLALFAQVRAATHFTMK